MEGEGIKVCDLKKSNDLFIKKKVTMLLLVLFNLSFDILIFQRSSHFIDEFCNSKIA